MNLIKSKKLKKFKSINHAFFNKAGGKSKGIYKSLNCGIGSKDSKFKVMQNLNIVKKKLGVKIIIWFYYIKNIAANFILLTRRQKKNL